MFRAAPAPLPRTLVEILAATTAAHPDAVALDDGTAALTYRELSRRVASVSERLWVAGIGAGDRVGIRISSGTAELYASILGVLESGAAYVPVDADDPDERAELVWAEAGVCAVLGNDGAMRLRHQSRPQGRCGVPLPDDDAWVIFTSGSSGTPKGVAITHRSASAFVDAEASMFCLESPLGPGDRVLAGLSVAFDASCEEMWLAWRHGACLVPAPRSLVRSGGELGPWLAEQSITVVSTVPTLAALWAAEALAGVRLLILGGEACSQQLAARLVAPGREVWNTYGPTEATVVACGAQLDGVGEVRIGLPLRGWSLAVVDEGGDPVRWGETGELVIGGVGLGRYLDASRDTAAYAPSPSLRWERAYRSGDLVRADKEGLVYIGRRDDQVKVGGRRVELGEIDAALVALPGVQSGAGVVQRTAGGNQVLVGYVVPAPDEAFDAALAIELLRQRLPAPLVPRLAVVDVLPVRTSGKVDRKALPWPCDVVMGEAQADDGGGLDDELAWLAQRWVEQLGPMPIGRSSNFFDLGGTSLAVALLTSALRTRYPQASVTDVYRHPTLEALASRLGELGMDGTDEGVAHRVPKRAGLVQVLIVLGFYTLTGLRVLTAFAVLAKLLGPNSWAPQVPWLVIGLAWLALLSLPGRLTTTICGVRLLMRGVRPGTYARGGTVHLRLWAAERLAAVSGLGMIGGTPLASRYARALGCEVGRDVVLFATPPVTGLAYFGDGCAVESGADLAGWWLDGDRLHVGHLAVGPGAQVGARVTLLPGAVVGDNAEIEAGSCVREFIPAGQRWGGSPARRTGTAGKAWPPARSGWSSGMNVTRYVLSLFGLGLLPLVAALPSLVLVVILLRPVQPLMTAVVKVVVAAPLLLFFGLFAYVVLTVVMVRLAGRGLREGFHPLPGRVAWCAWLTERLMNSARHMLFPVYASLLTPAWLRLLGARVGRSVEASTVLLMPGLTSIDDLSFLADDTLVAPPRIRGGWMYLAPVSIGNASFVGNSAIVGPGRTVPDASLIGVLSAAPAQMPPGSSWLGRPALEFPRTPDVADAARTVSPPRRLVIARTAIESCRVLPWLVGLLIGAAVFGVMGSIHHHAGLAVLAATTGLVLFLAGVVAAGVAAAAKWLLMGRFRAGEHPLWSSFVWRNELADCFVEMLAVPALAGPCLGTPLLNVWLRAMGARVGRGVCCETWWLPEFDLIALGDGVTVNRGTVLQTHLFHDRIMRLDRVVLASGATLGPNSIVLPGTSLGTKTSVAGASLVMRGESVPDHTRWLGNPIVARSDVPGRLVGVGHSRASLRPLRRRHLALATRAAMPKPALFRRQPVTR